MTRILVDIDDTLFNLVPNWLKVYNFYENDNLQPEDITDYDISLFSKNGNVIYKYLYPTLYNSKDIIPGALWGINELRNAGYEIYFVTSNGWNMGVKYKWLERNGFNPDKKHYFECGDRSLILCDYLIDDNYFSVLSTEGKGILFSQHWNMKNDYDTRVSGWFDLIHKFETGEING